MQEAAAVPAPSELAWPVREQPGRDDVLYGYLPSLDGLRAISILWVLTVHWPPQLSLADSGFVKRGALGVEIFFAISGFLVTRSLEQCVLRAARSNAGKGAVCRDFLVRRVARIWPPFFAALVWAFATMLVDPALRANFVNMKPILWSFPTFLANYTIPGNGAPLSLLVMWSLCFEEQFYIVLIALYLLGPRWLTKYIAGAALLSITARLIATSVHPEWFSTFSLQMEPHWRFDAIAWGCLAWIHRAEVAAWWRKATSAWLALPLLALIVVACVIDPATFWVRASWYLALAPLFTALVTALTFVPRFWLTRVLSSRPLVFIGTISYEIYLSHISVFRVLGRLHVDRVPALFYVLSFAGSVLAGWLFHRLFSKPTQRIVRSWLDRPSPSVASHSAE